MNKVITEPKQHNGRWYRIINVVDFIVDETYPSYYELEFVKVQMKIDFVLFKVWFTIKSYAFGRYPISTTQFLIG